MIADMERDFMGLNSKESNVAVKDSVPTKAPGSQWPFANEVSALPHFMRGMSAHNDNANKTSASPLASSCFAQNLAGFLAKPFHAPSIAGLADPWNKSVSSTAQMTIFCNGIVEVYDSVTPEKAQAIMFLAGSAGAQVRSPTPKVDSTDALPVNQVINAQPSSPVPVNKPPSAITYCKMDPPKQIMALGTAATANMIPRGIHQSRKVSLVRFLEKRKERFYNQATYNGVKKSKCTT